MEQRRAECDFEVRFSNRGSLTGRGFRFDIPGVDVTDEELSALIVRDLNLTMVGEVEITARRIISERHKKGPGGAPKREGDGAPGEQLIDLSHDVEDGMITYRGLPAPVVCDFLSRADSRAHYSEGTEFQIGQITMCANTGTYVDAPFHRYADGLDLAGLPLERLADLDAVVVNVTGSERSAIDRSHLLPYDLGAKAVLVHTGWDRHWRTDAYFEGHPFLTEDAAHHLVDEGAAFVGIDSLNIDDTDDGRRPVHSTLLAAGIPIGEHLTNLGALPPVRFRFSAVPVKVRAMGTFPVRAYARVPQPETELPE